MITISTEEKDNIVVFNISGTFNINTVTSVETLWASYLQKGPKMIAINCIELSSVDSAAIGTIVKFFNSAMTNGIRLVFYDLNPQIQKLFATAKLNKFFTITTGEVFYAQYMSASA